MNIYQCMKKAQEIGFDSAKFTAIFPTGMKECKWLDAYMGILTIEGIDDGFVTVCQIDDMFPDLFVSEPYVED
jgi:hypothetical protein